jgi:hypothetical protein
MLSAQSSRMPPLDVVKTRPVGAAGATLSPGRAPLIDAASDSLPLASTAVTRYHDVAPAGAAVSLYCDAESRPLVFSFVYVPNCELLR